MSQLLRFQPLYQERVWGGRRLATALGRTLPGSGPIGESWEIVDRPEAQSVVVGGTWSGRTLREVLQADAGAVMGPTWPEEQPFPILVKWLDCRERLSLQVHPPAAIAGQLKGEPKTENWYIAEAAPDSELIVGLRRGVTRAQFEAAMADETVESCVHHFSVGAGDSILVRSGQVHAIDAGNLILEIQQNSDTTYRVYDWGRLGLDGRPRQLHVEQSLRSIDWSDFEPEPIRAASTSTTLADAPEFRLRRVVLADGDDLRFPAREQPRLISVVAGKIRCRETGGSSDSAAAPASLLQRGDNALLAYAGEFAFVAEGPAIVLVTENFAG